MAELPSSADVVVIGAGHNGLVCAAYLAQAGIHVVVLEARDIVGGNTVTEALTLPGFAHDSCSSAHVLIQSNPLIRDDELELQATYGLTYLKTDPAVVLPQEGGDAVVIRRDLAATVDELARWSSDDAAAFEALMLEWEADLAKVHARWGAGEALGTGDAARRYDELRRRSAWDVVHERFSHPVVRSTMLWLGFATIQSPHRSGTGVLPAAITSGRLRHGWATPQGGSGALPDALVKHLEAHGGAVVASAPVRRIVTTDGRASAVETTDGGRVQARRAIVSSAHLAGLAGMLEGDDITATDLLRARDTWRPGLSLFAVHAALRKDIVFPTAEGPVASVAGGLGTARGLAEQLAAFDRGEAVARDPWVLLVASTVADPQRAPDGAGTLKLLTLAPHTRADGRSWEQSGDEYAAELMSLVHQRTGLAREDVLTVVAETPTGLAQRNRHNVGGSCHGGEFVVTGQGVLPGWPSYRCAVPGLYLTGATTHPGGSVSGRPGRNAARVVLTDLGIDPGRVMGAG